MNADKLRTSCSALISFFFRSMRCLRFAASSPLDTWDMPVPGREPAWDGALEEQRVSSLRRPLGGSLTPMLLLQWCNAHSPGCGFGVKWCFVGEPT
jgi:hypothetical protein